MSTTKRTRTHRAAVVSVAIAIAVVSGCSRPQDQSADEVQVAAAIADLEQAVAAAKHKVERLRDFDEIENLAGVYGFYVDKSRWDDIADLFTADGIVEILGRGVFYGQDRAREYYNNLPPMREGSLFNHMHMEPVIHVATDGKTANMRARLVVMFGVLDSNAQWGAGIYENELVKQDGVWKFGYLHAYQTFYTNYEDGWAKKASAIFPPYDRLPPDGPQSVAYEPYPAAFVPPFHYANPVSGRRDHYGRPHPPAPAP